MTFECSKNSPIKIQSRFSAVLHGIKWTVYLSRCQLKFHFPVETPGMQRTWLIRELDRFLLAKWGNKTKKKINWNFDCFHFESEFLCEKPYFCCATLVWPHELRPWKQRQQWWSMRELHLECSRRWVSCIATQWPKCRCTDRQTVCAHQMHDWPRRVTTHPCRGSLEQMNSQYSMCQSQTALEWHQPIFHWLRTKYTQTKKKSIKCSIESANFSLRRLK